MRMELIVMLILLTGCTKIAGTYAPDPIMDTSQSPYINTVNDISVMKLQLLSGSVSSAGSTLTGDNLKNFVATGMSLSDQKCEQHKSLILSNSNTWNVTAGTASILLAGAASVVESANAASYLAAGAAATTGTQALVNKEVYSNALATTILRAIDTVRAKKRNILEKGIASEDYKPAQAILDLQNYHDSCSLMAGLVFINESITSRGPSQKELSDTIDTITDELKKDIYKNEQVSHDVDINDTKKLLIEQLKELYKQRVD
jgi:hypothetical protein